MSHIATWDATIVSRAVSNISSYRFERARYDKKSAALTSFQISKTPRLRNAAWTPSKSRPNIMSRTRPIERQPRRVPIMMDAMHCKVLMVVDMFCVVGEGFGVR